MPEIKTYVDFSVWCGTCGSGICDQASVRDTDVTVDACPTCMREKDVEITKLEDYIRDLEDKVDDLEEQLLQFST